MKSISELYGQRFYKEKTVTLSVVAENFINPQHLLGNVSNALLYVYS
jgi:hypothetical protein